MNAEAGSFEYPDGSQPEVDPDTGLPILEDRSDEFPDQSGEPTEPIGDPLVETSDGFFRSLGAGSGMSGYRGLVAKRLERGLAVPAVEVEGESEQEQEEGQEAPEGSGTDDDTSGGENGPENVDQGSSDEGIDAGSEGDSGDDEEAGSGEPASDDDVADDAAVDSTPESTESAGEEVAADRGYDPAGGTVAEVAAYLSEHPDQAPYVLDRERTGKARVTLIGA